MMPKKKKKLSKLFFFYFLFKGKKKVAPVDLVMALCCVEVKDDGRKDKSKGGCGGERNSSVEIYQ